MDHGTDPRLAHAFARMEELRKEAADERLPRITAGRPVLAGLRRTLGSWLVSLGTGIGGSVDAGRRRIEARRGDEPWTA